MKKLELIFDAQNPYFVREAFNTLRTNVLFCGASNRTIIITSCYAHEGKTTVAMELSRSLAQNDKRVLLVDADLRMSLTAARYTKERGIVGLSQLLSGQAGFEQCVYRTQLEQLDIVFAGPYPPNPTELVGSEMFEEFLERAEELYDYIIIDAPPLGLVIDAAVMAEHCDGAIIVVNKGRVRFRQAQSVKEQLERSGCRCLGVVLNQAAKNTDELRRRYQEQEYYQQKADGESSAMPKAAPLRMPAVKQPQKNASTQAQKKPPEGQE